MLIPSISIAPSNISTILDNERHIVLLPAPVLPTTPIFSPDYSLKLNLSRAISVFGLYLKDAYLNSITPSSGHDSLPTKSS
jgi:hypothetical protein